VVAVVDFETGTVTEVFLVTPPVVEAGILVNCRCVVPFTTCCVVLPLVGRLDVTKVVSSTTVVLS